MKSLTGVLLFRFITITIISLFPTLRSSRQNVVLSNEAINVLYRDIANPIAIAVEGCNCNTLILETDNGKLIKVAPCKYSIDSLDADSAHVIIKQKQGNSFREIGRKKFRVKSKPRPFVSIAGRSDGALSKSILLTTTGISAQYYLTELNLPEIKVTQYSIIIIRAGEVIFNKENVGAVFNGEVKTAIQNIAVGDIIFIESIYCSWPDKSQKAFNPMSITIIP